MFSFCLNCQEVFEPVQSVKLYSYVTLSLPCLAPVCRLSYQTHQVDGWKHQSSKKCGLSVTIQAFEYSLYAACCRSEEGEMNKFWLLINFSVYFAKVVGEARQVWVAVKRNSKRRTIDG